MDGGHVTKGTLAKAGLTPADLGRSTPPPTDHAIVIDWDDAVPLDFGDDSHVLLGDRVHFDRA